MSSANHRRRLDRAERRLNETRGCDRCASLDTLGIGVTDGRLAELMLLDSGLDDEGHLVTPADTIDDADSFLGGTLAALRGVIVGTEHRWDDELRTRLQAWMTDLAATLDENGDSP